MPGYGKTSGKVQQINEDRPINFHHTCWIIFIGVCLDILKSAPKLSLFVFGQMELKRHKAKVTFCFFSSHFIDWKLHTH